MSKIRKPHPRDVKPKRGVILLIVVSLLTMLVLIGVTFVLFANRSQQNSNVANRREEYREPPDKMFEQVVWQLLYDTMARSALRGQSLLQDLYGPDHVYDDPSSETPQNALDDTQIALVNGAMWGGQGFAFQVRPETLQSFPAMPPLGPGPLSPLIDYYAGRLLTFRDGPAQGFTYRILQYDPTANNGPQFVIEVDQPLNQPVPNPPVVGNRFIINGAPCNGTGAGFDDTNVGPPNPPVSVMNMAAVYAHQSAASLAPPNFPTGDLVALLPHYNAYDPNFGQVYLNAASTPPNPPPNPVPIDQGLARGGFDESWDAPDFQNMFLAMQTPHRAEQAQMGTFVPMLPSFHRPELVNYWVEYIIARILDQNSGIGSMDRNDPNQVPRMFQIMAQPYGPDGSRNFTADNPTEVPIEHLDRIYNITRCSIFRPMPWDHPNFTGSNPLLTGVFDGANPPNIMNAQALFMNLINLGNLPLFDVDNDNDGYADSIWVDAGLPVVTRPDGKRYKRLFAIMVQDLDGRIDLNAHGNLMQVAPIPGQFIYPNRPQFPVPPTPLGQPSAVGLAVGQPTNPNLIYLPRGVGYGPAEVDFLNLFIPPTNTPPGPTTDFQVNPATGATVTAIQAYENILRGRYESSAVGPAGIQDLGATAVPGVPRSFEALNIVKQHGSPNDYANQLSWYASPPDVWGRGAVVLDWGGQPLYWPLAGTGWPPGAPPPDGEMLDNPYEISLGGGVSNSDSPYTLVEIERMLRYHDVDAQRLPSRPLAIDQLQAPADRLLTLNVPGIIGRDHTARQRMSGRTAYLPVPAGQVPGTQIVPPGTPSPPSPNGSWRAVASTLSNGNQHPGNMTIADMYAGKILTQRVVSGLPTTPAFINTVLHQLMPWELRHGGKLDLNRWLGNGFDAPAPFNDNVVDDPIEAVIEPGPPLNGPRELGWNSPPQFMVDAEHSNGMDVNNDGATNALDRMLARQLLARHLYCLALLFIDPTFDPLTPHEPNNLNTQQRQELMARRIAQWAVNVVDYRDSDAIMTPFEYDINPWNGWDVDSRLETDGGVGPRAEQRFNPATGMVEPVVWQPPPPGNNYWPTPAGPGPRNERRLVWGTEQPELLITETLAFHMRNVKDTDVAGPNAGGMADMKRMEPMTTDPDLDQFRIPQGSLFIEVYCPRAYRWQQSPPPGVNQQGHQKPRLPLELYDTNGFLQLGRVAPGGRPVWRLAIAPLLHMDDQNDPALQYHPQTLAGVRTDRSPDARLESSSFDWQETSLLAVPGVTTPAPVVPAAMLNQFRYAYFGNANALPANELAQSYHNTTSNPLLQPGGYAVIGPRALTYLGSCNPGANPIMWDTALGTNGYSNQRFELNVPNVLNIFDTAGTQTTRTPVTEGIRNVVSIIADYQGTPVSGGNQWTIAAHLPWRSGLNITEPLLGTNYYPEPMDPADLTTPGLPPDAGFYDDPDPTVALNDGTGFKNTPVEAGDPGSNPIAANANRPIYDNGMQNTGTFEDVSSVYLERLANPNLPWNPLPSDPVFGVNGQFPSYNNALLVNPYITVDWATIDVTVSAGDEDTDRMTPDGEWIDPDDEDPTVEPPQTAFRSRQRAYQQGYKGPPAPQPVPTIPDGPHQSHWSPVTRNIQPYDPPNYPPYGDTPDGDAMERYFNVDLSNNRPDNAFTNADRHTFGYLNAGLGYPALAAPGAPPPPPHVQAYLGEARDPNSATQDPAPFPWLTFANRPFANPYELMMVPTSAPSRLALEITPGHLSQSHLLGPPAPPAPWGSNPNPYNANDQRALRMPFGHLLNFFHTEDTGAKGAPQPPAFSPHFNRIFDYVEVPSPFATAERWYNPT
ncbi:MAG: hypothetical protein L0211_06900, partial [Planctomycetaceae bacterium]|nr:hypothetical protein [Planctomycetaceae bacterium]